MAKQVFRRWDVSQGELFPAAIRDAVPPDHLVHFVARVVADDLDLSAIYARYTGTKGQPPYHPAMMTALLLYACCRGIYSSRKIETSCVERLDFRALVGAERPDHSTIAQFRKEHRDAVAELFVQVLQLCRDAGMAKLGHIALDGTMVKANASKHAAMSYARMKAEEPELAKVVDEWMSKSESTDDAEDGEHGKDRRGDEIPEHVLAKARKLAQIRAAQVRLEAQAAERAEHLAAERAAKEAERGSKLPGSPPKALDGEVEPKAQSNFTDPESRIMKTSGGYEQAYNAQAAVDADSQVIVACAVTAEQNDGGQMVPLVDAIARDVGTGLRGRGLLLRVEPRRARGARDRRLRRDGPAEARHGERDEQRDGQPATAHERDAREAAPRRLRESVPPTQANSGTGLRPDQGGTRIPPLRAARARERARGMGAALHGAQPAQALRPHATRGRLKNGRGGALAAPRRAVAGDSWEQPRSATRSNGPRAPRRPPR
jgi:transposase